MKLSKAQLALYRHEFETTTITLELLCEKYNIQLEDLTNSNRWTKRNDSNQHSATIETQPTNNEFEILPPETDATTISLEEELEHNTGIEPAEIVIDEPEDLNISKQMDEGTFQHAPETTDEGLQKNKRFDISIVMNEEELLQKTLQFKSGVMQHCINWLSTDLHFSELKELKEIVNVVDTIDKSVRPKETEKPTVQVQVLVQNLMSGIADDC